MPHATTRRDFLLAAGSALLWPGNLFAESPGLEADSGALMIQTVHGSRPAESLGFMLPHEHILVDFIGADQVSPDRYEREKVIEAVLPYLKRYKDLGGQALAECTPAFLGRDPALLRRLSELSGVEILTNTGLYGASVDKFLPPFAFTETADQLAERWIAEWRDGIEGTGIRPGFIKIGVDGGGPLSSIHRKLVQAAARAHKATGLPIAAHTGPGAAALEELEIIEAEGVRAEAFIWVHAQAEGDHALHLEAARRGAWVEFDSVGQGEGDDPILAPLLALRDGGALERILISHDAGWYDPGKPAGGAIRGYDAIFTKFIPALRQAGLTDLEIKRLTVDQPARAFAIRPRLLESPSR